MQAYLSENTLLTNVQFGFRKGKGTENAVHSVVEYMHQSFDENKFAIGIFLDVKKAFNSLDRNILLEKLKYYGISGNEWNWFRSYLSNRRQLTVYENFNSDLKNVNFGVPQGGIISPILFLIYVNDIVNCCKESNCVLYADDTSIYTSSPNINELFEKANQSLAKFKCWFDSNKLTLNAKKTHYVLFHRKQRKVPINDCKLYVSSIEVKKVVDTKFLGVVLDCNLSWSHHILNLSRKLAKFAPIIYRVRKLCTHKSLKLIYNCLIYSNLVYCNSVWGHCKNVALKPLLTMHKRIIRSIAGVNISHPTHELFQRFSFLTLPNINLYMVGIFMYKCSQNEEYVSWFRQSENVRSTRSTEQNLMHVPQIHTEHSKQCIKYRGPTVWNDISLNIRIKSYDTFKVTFKSSLLSS